MKYDLIKLILSQEEDMKKKLNPIIISYYSNSFAQLVPYIVPSANIISPLLRGMPNAISASIIVTIITVHFLYSKYNNMSREQELILMLQKYYFGNNHYYHYTKQYVRPIIKNLWKLNIETANIAMNSFASSCKLEDFNEIFKYSNNISLAEQYKIEKKLIEDIKEYMVIHNCDYLQNNQIPEKICQLIKNAFNTNYKTYFAQEYPKDYFTKLLTDETKATTLLNKDNEKIPPLNSYEINEILNDFYHKSFENKEEDK